MKRFDTEVEARRVVAEAMLARDAAVSARRRHGDRLAGHAHDERRCRVCHERVFARQQHAGWLQTVWVFPLDGEGRCADCAWMGER